MTDPADKPKRIKKITLINPGPPIPWSEVHPDFRQACENLAANVRAFEPPSRIETKMEYYEEGEEPPVNTDPASAAARELFPHENSAVHDPVATVIRRHYAPLVERERRLRELLKRLVPNVPVGDPRFGIGTAITDEWIEAALSPTEGTP